MENFKNFINEESDFEIEIGKEITPNDPSVKNVPIYELTPKEEILGWFIKTKIDREELGKDTNINPDVKHLTGKKLEELFPKKYLDQIFNKNLKEFFGPRVSEYANSPCGVRTLAGIFDVSDDYLFYDMNYARY